VKANSVTNSTKHNGAGYIQKTKRHMNMS